MLITKNKFVMKYIDKVLRYFGFKNFEKSIQSTPNTWGYQVYQYKFRKIKRDHQLDLNNHTYQKGFIERFTSTYMNCIHLKNRINNYPTINKN